MDSIRSTRRPAVLLALVLSAATGLVTVPGAGGGAAREPVRAVGGTAVHAPAGLVPTADVVVRALTGGVDAAAEAVRRAGGVVGERLPLVDGVSARLPAAAVLAPAFAVTPNVAMQTAGGDPAPDRTASPVRTALGLGPADGQGRGVVIAVVDTGVDEHADLTGRLVHVDVTREPTSSFDGYGHGTFVAGAAAGDGRTSGGRYAGVAPGAQVLDVRVAGDDGRTDLVTVLRGLQVAHERGVDVLNLSLSSGSPLPYQVDPLTVALDRLWAEGVVVVVPSGNEGGSGRRSITSPGVDPVLLTVGALDERATGSRDDDVVADFSGRGPAPQGVAKPDLVAPGQSLVSLRAPGSVVDLAHPEAVVESAHFRGSGTSFSTAVVAGAAAVLLQERPELSPDQVKALVTRTAYGTGRTQAEGLRDVTAAGAGGLDVPAALAARTPHVRDAVLAGPPPGQDDVWEALVAALIAGDAEAVASSWSQLSPAAHRWAASSWSAHRWADQPWELQEWAAHRWAAHRWAASSWSAHRWAGEDWGGSQWYASRWASSRWADTWQ